MRKHTQTSLLVKKLVLNSRCVCVGVCETDAAAGTVKIRNASMAVSGSYRCTAQNRVGADQCVLELKITTREYHYQSTHTGVSRSV